MDYYFSVLDVPSVIPSFGPLLHELRNDDDDVVAAEQRGRTRLQRMWIVLQAARCQSTLGHEERWNSDQEEEAQGWWGQ